MITKILIGIVKGICGALAFISIPLGIVIGLAWLWMNMFVPLWVILVGVMLIGGAIAGVILELEDYDGL